MVCHLQITPGNDANKFVSQSQDECTPVRKQSKTKPPRKSTKTKKVDSPLGKIVASTGQWFRQTALESCHLIYHQLLAYGLLLTTGPEVVSLVFMRRCWFEMVKRKATEHTYKIKTFGLVEGRENALRSCALQ